MQLHMHTQGRTEYKLGKSPFPCGHNWPIQVTLHINHACAFDIVSLHWVKNAKPYLIYGFF